MLKIFIKILILAISLLAVIQLLSIERPFYWGNENLMYKMGCVQDDIYKYDCYFIGSSRTHRHLDVRLFDELNGAKTKSYNLGSMGSLQPEGLMMVKEILQAKKDFKPKSIIMELMIMDHKDLTIDQKSNYYFNFGTLVYSLKYFITDDYMNIGQRFSNSSLMVRMSVANAFKAGNISKMLFGEYDRKPSEKGYTDCELLDHGYCPFELSNLGASGEEIAMLKKRRKLYKTHVQDLSKRKNFHLKQLGNLNELVVNEAALSALEELHELAANKGINLVYYLPPRLKEMEVNELLSIYKSLSNKYKIDVSSPDRFPDLYEDRYSFDLIHLNKEGSKRFTEYLAQQFLQLNLD